jgi:putative oxidoreductase
MKTDRFAPYLLSLMRAVFGCLFLFHGLQKLFGMFGRDAVSLASLAGLAGAIELGAGFFIAVGWKTRPAALLASGEMAVAYFLAHQPNGLWPIQNNGELSALYCFAFLYLSVRGGGPLGFDRR